MENQTAKIKELTGACWGVRDLAQKLVIENRSDLLAPIDAYDIKNSRLFLIYNDCAEKDFRIFEKMILFIGSDGALAKEGGISKEMVQEALRNRDKNEKLRAKLQYAVREDAN